MAIFGANKLPRVARPNMKTDFETPAERYQTVARELLYGSKQDESGRVIGLTSSGAAEGVTTATLQLARAAAYLSDSPVLLVDGNTGSPSIEQRLDLPNSKGLRDILSGRQQLAECVRPTAIPKLAVLGPGAPMRGSDIGEWNDAMLQMRKHFPLVLVDLPPATELGSQLISATGFDGVLLVVEAERTRRQAVLRAKSQLERMEVTILGVILNKRRNHVPAWLYKRI